MKNIRRKKMRPNTGNIERAMSTISGGFLLGYALIKRSKFSIPLGLFGVAGLYRGITGHCPVYSYFNINRSTAAQSSLLQGRMVRKTTIVDQPVEEVYRYWRQVENLPRFIQHLQSIRPIDETRSHWTAGLGKVDDTIQWEAEMIIERENRMLAWRSLPGYRVENQVVVEFIPDEENKSTEIILQVIYTPPDTLAANPASSRYLFGESLDTEIQEDLERFRHLVIA
jgi:uncharacterized membrane protein